MSVIYLNQKAREWHISKKTDIFIRSIKKLKLTDLSVDKEAASRFGDNLPGSWNLTIKEYIKESISKINEEIWVDVYLNGCTQDNSLNPYREKMMKEGKWNRPSPLVPSDEAINSLVKSLVRRKVKSVNIGLKNDAFSWLDFRYKKSIFLLEQLNLNNIDYVIYTESDLCAHLEYISLCKGKIVFRELFTTEEEQRIKAPGSPSKERIRKASNIVSGEFLRSWTPEYKRF